MHAAMQNPELDQPWTFKWDVIHFNIGLHDLKFRKSGKRMTPVDTYQKNLLDIVAYLKTLSPKAKLIFATTTPVPEGERERVAGDGKKFNDAALEVMHKCPEIMINDLYGFTKPKFDIWQVEPGNVHYTREGQNAQGDEVARIISAELSKVKK